MSNKRQAIRHSAVYSLANLLGRLAGFVMLPFYSRIFETEGYGIIALVDTTVGLLTIAFSTGVHQSILKIYHEEPDDRKSLVIGTSILTVWILSLLCIPLPVIASPMISNYLLNDAKHWLLIVLALMIFVIDMGGRSASTFLVINQQSLLYSAVNLIQLVVGIFLNIYLVIYLRVGIVGVFISSIITASIGSFVFHFEAIRRYGLHYDSSIRKKMIRFWFPLIPGELAAYIGRQSERFIMKFLVGLNGVGILEMAYKFPPLLNIIVTFPFLRAWQTKCLEIGDQPDGPREIATMFTFYLFLLLFGGVLLAANISTVLKIMTPPDFWPAARMAQIDIVTTIVYAAGSYLIFGLLYTKNTKVISSVKSIAAIGRIIFSYMFISLYGIKGAVISALLIETVFLVYSFRRSQVVYKLSLEYLKISILVVFAIILVLAIDVIHLVPTSIIGAVGNLLSGVFTCKFLAYLCQEWHACKIFTVLNEHAHNIASLLVNCSVSALFGLSIIVVKPDMFRWSDTLKTKIASIINTVIHLR